jgi:hypothetical protein
MDLNKIENIEIEYDTDDFPDFTDAFIVYAEIDGRKLNNNELKELNENSEYKYQAVLKDLY